MLITITGPTGSGKSTLAQALLAQGVHLVPTWTTRPLRPEEEGRGDMIHVSAGEMAEQEMLETAEYDGHRYGTPLTPEVMAALEVRADALKILEPVGLTALREKLAGGAFLTAPQLAHVYVDIDVHTARERLLTRCHHQPSDADRRRLERVARECREWPGACPWTLVVDNRAPAESLAKHAKEVMHAMRTHISEQRAMGAEDSAMMAANAEEVEQEVALLFRLLARHRDAGIHNVVAQGQEALEHDNQPLVRESLQQLQGILKDWEVHPALANQLRVASQAAGAGQVPAAEGREPVPGGERPDAGVTQAAGRFGNGPSM